MLGHFQHCFVARRWGQCLDGGYQSVPMAKVKQTKIGTKFPSSKSKDETSRM